MRDGRLAVRHDDGLAEAQVRIVNSSPARLGENTTFEQRVSVALVAAMLAFWKLAAIDPVLVDGPADEALKMIDVALSGTSGDRLAALNRVLLEIRRLSSEDARIAEDERTQSVRRLAVSLLE